MEQLELDIPGLSFIRAEHLPRRPYCSANLENGVRIRPLMTALKLPYIQINPPSLKRWLVFDVDRSGAALAWEDAGLPAPAWAATNPANGHAHLAWGLDAPVLTGDGSRPAPLRYAVAVEQALHARLRADPGYSGLITKTPGHVDWRMLIGDQRLWTLGELSEWLDLPKYTPKLDKDAEQIGLGRNITLFNRLRKWSYVAVRAERSTRNFVLWQARVYDKSLEMNGDFRVPLDYREAFHTAKSVTRFAWKHDFEALSRFQQRQAFKGSLGGKKSGAVRLAASEDKRASARLMALAGGSSRLIAAELDVDQSTVVRWLKG